MPATLENAASTSAYATKRKTNAVKVMTGHMKASTPKRIAAIPRSTRAHQLLANTSNICFLLLFVRTAFLPVLLSTSSRKWFLKRGQTANVCPPSGAQASAPDCCESNNLSSSQAPTSHQLNRHKHP